MKRLLLTQLIALVALCSIAEARIQTPGSVTTGPFHHGAAVAHEKMRQKQSAPKAQPTENQKEQPAPAAENQPRRKRFFGRKTVIR